MCSELFEAIEKCFISRDKAPEHISLFGEHKYSKRILDQISGSLDARPMYEEWEALEHGALDILESLENFSGSIFYSAAYMALVFSPKNADKEAPPALCVLYVISRHLLFSLEAGKLNEQKMFSLNLMIDRFLYWCAFSRAGKNPARGKSEAKRENRRPPKRQRDGPQTLANCRRAEQDEI